MDDLDLKAIQQLMLTGRITWSELATMLGLSAPATADRVRRLEERNVIKGYTAVVDAEVLGYNLMAFVAVTLERPEHRASFLHRIHTMSEVQECHHTAGDDDYILKIRCRNTRDLERVVSDELKSISGVTRTRTTIVLSTLKESSLLPLSVSES